LNETVWVVAIAAVLSAGAVAALVWRTRAFDASSPERLIGELGVARWAAALIAGVGGISIGLAVARPELPLVHVDAALGVIFIGIGGIVLLREPRDGLLVAAGALLLHALLNIAHRPGWLPVELASHWFRAGLAIYDVLLAAMCFWVRRR
jgi:hypothetical protein